MKNLLSRFVLLTLLVMSGWTTMLFAQAINVSGTVVDAETDEPLIGATVRLKGVASKGCTTDVDGNFSFTGILPEAVLEVSYLGYKNQTISVNGMKRLTIKLLQNSEQLNEVVVIGYGTMDKKELTSSISHINEKDFLKSTSLDVSMMIQGKVPSVSITNTGAADPNNQASIQIRGVSSRSAGTGPLIVIDGIPGGNLTNINPNDIASFDILKDGAAAAIYGTRGSNGVILVTTKKGTRDGQIHTSYMGTVSASVANHELDMLTAKQYRALRIPGGYGNDLGGNDDWLDAVTRTGWMHQHTLSLSGGNNKNNYRVSIDYRKAEGVDLYSSREEYGGRAGIQQTTRNGLFTFTANVAPRLIKRKNSSWDVFRNTLEINPTTPIMDVDNPGQYTAITGQAAGYNPVELINLEDNTSETKLLDYDATAKLNLLPLLWKDSENGQILNTQITFAGHESSNFDSWFRPSTSTLAIAQGYSGEGSRKYAKQSQRILEWLTNYNGSFCGHNVKAMVGYSYQYTKDQNLSGENKDFINDGIGSNNLGTGDWDKEEGHVGVGSWAEDSKLIAFFGRVSYDWKSRYLLTASLRHEGSSKFGKDHKWGNFPGISLGWRINRENFMKNVNWMDNLKLRVGYGVTGINVADPYTSLSSLNYNGAFLYNGTWVKALETIRNNNADLRWEKKHEFNVGLDWDVLGGRLGGTVDYYIRRTKDALWDYEVPVPPYMYPTMLANASEMENKGLEILIRATPIQTEKFTWNTNVSYSTNSNKVVALSSEKFSMDQDYFYTGYTGEPIQTTTHIVQVGKPIGTFYGLKSVDITDDGLWLVENKKGEHVLAEETDATDWQVLGNGIPKHYLNWNNTFNFFNFDLSINMRGAFGFQILNYQRMYYENAKPEIQYNRLNSAFDKVYGKTQLKDDQRYVSYYVEDGDYWKIDNVTLGYTFKLSKQHIIKNLRIYASVLNLATITGYKGMDPEVPLSSNTYGLLDAGTDNRDKYPTNRTYTFGVNLTF